MKTQLINSTPDPCKTMALAARTCYSETNPLENSIFHNLNSESEYWDWLLSACIKKGHYSPLEYCQVTILATDVPMPTVVQLRTHRQLSMQVQSLRYTRFDKSTTGFSSRLGNELYTQLTEQAVTNYRQLVESGIPNEIARDILPCSYTQNFILSANLRELFHIFKMRSAMDAQFEIRELVTLMRDSIMETVPDPMQWFTKKHWAKFKGEF